MKNIYLRLLSAALTLFCISANAQTVYTLDWASSFGTWADGQTAGNALNVNGSGVNCYVNMTVTSGTFAIAGGTTNQTPTLATPFVVAGSTAKNRISLNLTSNAGYADITYSFSTPVTGVKFNISDLDKAGNASTSYYDRITVTGQNGSFNHLPQLRKYVVSSAIIGYAAGNQASANTVANQGGNSVSDATDQDGTITVDFGTAVIESFTIRYDNAPDSDADPAAQAIAIGNLGFQRINLPPVAANFTTTPLQQGAAATAIPALTAADQDSGLVVSYTIASIPNTTTQGTLSCCGGTAVSVNQVLTAAQISTLQFDPFFNYTGTAAFTFTATDNMGALSNVATYRIPVIAQSPVANNIMEATVANTAGAAAVEPLNAADADGTISIYQITSLPTAAQGVFSVPCPPTFTGATCTGGFQNLTAAVLANYPLGIPLTPAQAAAMRFDPAASFVGTAILGYNAVDNSNNTSNAATLSVPVAATASLARPPVADNIRAQSLNNSLGNTAIPALQASDLDGSIASFRILSIPNTVTEGTLRCCGGTAVAANQVLTPAQASTLQFDPLATYTGAINFTYTATDNDGLVSNTAVYTIPVVNRQPVASNITTKVNYNGGVTVVAPLSGHDVDGIIASYTITSVPTAAQGVISVSCPATFAGATCTGGFQNLTPAVLAANSNALVLTAAQAASLRFAPAAAFTGSAPFNYFTTDNNTNASAAAVYTFVVDAQPPVSTDVTNATLANSAGSTLISPLTGTDADGTIAGYTILTLPAAAEGVLFIGATAVTIGQVLTPAQMATLRFDPAGTFTGVSAFSFNSVDNSGFTSNTAAYYIPVSGTGNIPPVARNITALAMPNTAASTAISNLVGNDADGTIASYTVTSIPDASQGVLYYGATAITGVTMLTPAQAATLRFDPATGFVGTANFNYTTTDNGGATSYSAYYNIPVTGVPPVATPVTVAPISQTAGATAVSGLTATDADGSIAMYYVETLPPATQGVLSIPCPPNLTGATCTGGFQNLTAAVLAAYPNGIPLTTTQAAGLRFDPAGAYAGNVVFNFHAVDNSNLVSNPATYTIPVSALNPLANNVVAPKLLNGAASTNIPALAGADADGSIGSYTVTSIPGATQGILYYGSTPITAGMSLTPAQAATLRFDPAAGFTGNALFNYFATDNTGNISSAAAYTIPVGTSTTLAVSGLVFTAERKASDIVLQWKSENETALVRYEVEWSADGTSFTNGGNVAARNATANSYGFTLRNYTAPVYHLRLRIVDADAKISYSHTVTVRMSAAITTSFSLSPNPAAGHLNIRITSAVSGAAALRIVNAVGETVYQQTEKIAGGDNVMSLNNLSRLASGTYLLRMSVNGETISQRFVISR